MSKLKSAQEIVEHVPAIVFNTDITHISTDMRVLCSAIKALAIENILFQGEDSEELSTVWERLEELKKETNWSLRPLVRYSTGEALEIYLDDPYFDQHGKEKDFLKEFGKNKVDKAVLIHDEVVLYLVAGSADDLLP